MRELRALGLVWDFQDRDKVGGFLDRGVVCSNTLPAEPVGGICPSSEFTGRPNLPKDGSAVLRKNRPLNNKRVINNKRNIKKERVENSQNAFDRLNDKSWAIGIIDKEKT